MDLYLAGDSYDVTKYILEQRGGASKVKDKSINIALLRSFYYCDKWVEAIIPKLKRFMLDSGAFTFFMSGKQVNWMEYIEKYIHFINQNHVERFFELDIDVLVGHDKVVALRKRLEKGINRQCIPVWHKSRGIDEFLRLCEEYEYVALGGVVPKEITRKDYQYFPWFIKEAHKRNAKLHALGFTQLQGIRKYHFDSVDSSTWLAGNRFGYVQQFNGETMIKHRPAGMKLKDQRAVAIHNFNEWVKFQRYAEQHL